MFSHIRHDLNRVGVLNLDDVDRQCGLAIIEGAVFGIGGSLRKRREVTEIDGRATAPCDDHIQQRLRLGDTALHLDRAFGDGVDEAAGRAVAVAVAQRGHHLVDAHSERAHAGIVDHDVDLPLAGADERCLPHTGNGRQLPQHPLVGKGSERGHVERCRADRHRQDRLGGGIEPGDDRFLGILGEIPVDGGDLVAHVLCRGCALNFESEFCDDDGAPLVGGRCDLVEAANGVQRILDGARQLRLHRLRRGAGIGGDHHHDRNVDIGVQIQPQPLQ